MGTTANKPGRVAGTNAAGGEATFNGVVGAAITKALHLGVRTAGLTERAAKGLGIAAKGSTVQHGTRAHYYSTPGPMNIKLVRNPED